MVEGLEQAGAPCVPKFGVGAADVGNGKQVECVEVFACGNTAAKGLEDMGILDVFFLGNGRHEQVVLGYSSLSSNFALVALSFHLFRLWL